MARDEFDALKKARDNARERYGEAAREAEERWREAHAEKVKAYEAYKTDKGAAAARVYAEQCLFDTSALERCHN